MIMSMGGSRPSVRPADRYDRMRPARPENDHHAWSGWADGEAEVLDSSGGFAR